MLEKNVFDLNECSLDGVAIGSKLSSSLLDDKNFGYQIYLKNNCVSGFFFCFRDGYKGYKSFSGEFLFGDNAISISEATTPDELIRVFGVPESQWDDGMEGNLEFHLENGYLLEFSWNTSKTDHRLDYLIVEEN